MQRSSVLLFTVVNSLVLILPVRAHSAPRAPDAVAVSTGVGTVQPKSSIAVDSLNSNDSKDSNSGSVATIPLSPANATVSAFSVVLDPGHGGRDHGATHGNLKESEIALKVALKLEKLLEADPNFHVSMTRTTDQTLTLEERTVFAKREKADLYLSIHLNSSTDSRAQGKEFYFQNQLPVDEDSMFLASRENNLATPEPGTHEPRGPMAASKNDADPVSKRSDVRNIIDDLKRNERIHSSSLLSKILFETWVTQQSASSNRVRRSGSRAIRQAPFFVIANSDAPAVLVELGFITHPTEGPRMALATYQDDLAQSLYDGLVKFRNRYTGEISPNSPKDSGSVL